MGVVVVVTFLGIMGVLVLAIRLQPANSNGDRESVAVAVGDGAPEFAAQPLPGDVPRVEAVRLRKLDVRTPLEQRRLEILQVIQHNRFKTSFTKETTHNGAPCIMFWTADPTGQWLEGELRIPPNVPADAYADVIGMGVLGAVPKGLYKQVVDRLSSPGEFQTQVDGFTVTGVNVDSTVRVAVNADSRAQ